MRDEEVDPVDFADFIAVRTPNPGFLFHPVTPRVAPAAWRKLGTERVEKDHLPTQNVRAPPPHAHVRSGPHPVDLGSPLSEPSPADSNSASRPGSASRTHIRGSALLLAGRAISLALNFASQVMVIRYLSKESWGAFSTVIAIVGVGSVINIIGLPRTIGRFAPIYEEKGEFGRLIGSVIIGLLSIVGLGVAATALVYGMRGSLAGAMQTDPLTVELLLIMVVLAPIGAFDTLTGQLLAAFTNARTIFFRKHVVTPGLRLLAVLSVVLGAGDARSLAFAYVIAGGIGATVYGGIVLRAFRDRRFFARAKENGVRLPTRELLAFSVPLISSDVLYIARTTCIALAIDYHYGAEEVADYRAILPISRLNTLVLTNFAYMFLPVAARLFARNAIGEMQDLYSRSAVWVTVLSFPIFAVSFALSDSVTSTLFGEKYASAAALLAIAALGDYLYSILGFDVDTLRVFGKVRWIVICDVATLIVVALGCWFLIPTYGSFGAAIAVSLTLVLYRVLNTAALWYTTGIQPLNRGLCMTMGWVAVLTTGIYLAQRSWDLGLWTGIPLAAAATIVLLRVSRRDLDAETLFPELRKLPGIRSIR